MGYKSIETKRAAGIKRSRRKYFEWKAEGRCVACGADRDGGGVRCAACRDRHARYKSSKRKRLKDAVFAYYGGRCVKCGTTKYLTVHHINNDGAETRQCIDRAGADFYEKIIATLPTDIELVCNSCHAKIPTRRWRLTDAQRDNMRRLYVVGGVTFEQLGRAFNVSGTTAYYAVFPERLPK